MNMFIVFKTKDGSEYFVATMCLHNPICSTNHIGTELVTPPLDGMILPGVTRDSVLALARDHASGVKRLAGLPKKLIVSERLVTMKEVKEASQSGSLVELFGTGNALCSLTSSRTDNRFCRDRCCHRSGRQNWISGRGCGCPNWGRWDGPCLQTYLEAPCQHTDRFYPQCLECTRRRVDIILTWASPTT